MEATRKGNNTDAMAGLAPVVERVAAGAHEAVDKAASAATAAAKLVEQKGEQLKAVQARYLDGAREQVRENPLAALGVALAAGFLISLLLNRR
jgi:ElaB/YqjD/DUF883 family membrane-anchored ribosome-binding protein